MFTDYRLTRVPVYNINKTSLHCGSKKKLSDTLLISSALLIEENRIRNTVKQRRRWPDTLNLNLMIYKLYLCIRWVSTRRVVHLYVYYLMCTLKKKRLKTFLIVIFSSSFHQPIFYAGVLMNRRAQNKKKK